MSDWNSWWGRGKKDSGKGEKEWISSSAKKEHIKSRKYSIYTLGERKIKGK